jgi:hypothetical protein
MASLKRFTSDPDGPRLLGQPVQSQKAPPHRAVANYKANIPPSVGISTTSSRSVSSVGSSSSILSGTPSNPCTVSTAPSLGGVRQPSLNMSPEQDGYVLPCILGDILGCPAIFAGQDFTYWFDHSISHYVKLESAGLPKYARCIFCDDVFKSTNAYKCWHERMSHIAYHFQMGMPIEDSRPDFSVINDMRNKGLLSDEDYYRCARGCERPPVDGLRPHDWEPEEKKAKREADAEKANRIPVPLSRQEKQRKPTFKSGKPKSLVSIKHQF